MKFRVYLILFFTMAVFIAVIGRLFQIQVLERSKFQEISMHQNETAKCFERQRGTIYDRRGRELAVSVKIRSLAANPQKFTDPLERKKVSKTLSELLGISEEILADKLSRPNEFVWLARKLNDDIADSIALLNIHGLFFQTEFQRYYPHDSTAAHILGFVGLDDAGLEGIERAMDDELKGPEIEGNFVLDPMGNLVPRGELKYRRFDGHSIHLTIDLTIQSFLETALKLNAEAYGAKSASGVVIDPATGEILGLANYPSYDPNFASKYEADARRNRAITDLFEPGSTFKVFSGALALGQGVVKPEDTFYCPGVLRVAGFSIKCHKAHGTLDYRRAIEASCNVTAMLVAQRLDPNVMYHGLRSFGFGERTGIELQGEEEGVLRPVKDWSKLSLSTLAIGQEISVTAIQLAMATGAMANGGRLMQPRLIRSIDNSGGKAIRTYPPHVRTQVIPSGISRLMGNIMEGVVSHGTGQLAAVKLFNVSGKTGTGQISGPTGGYMKGHYNAVFIGWVPSEAPVLAMAIVVREPDPSKGYYGGTVAAPIFGWIATEALRYLHIISSSAPDTSSVLPATVQAPRQSGAVREGKVVIPDLIGLTLREAHELISTLPLSFKPLGSGVAVKQTPNSGELLPLDSVVEVEFQPPGGIEHYAEDVGE